MGTHPIFESDFDCLTECQRRRQAPEKRRKNKRNGKSYFCSMLQKTVICGSCGMGKCMNKSPGGCLVRHGQNYVTGIKLAGGICDHCEAFVCHGRQCISTHGCACPLIDAV